MPTEEPKARPVVTLFAALSEELEAIHGKKVKVADEYTPDSDMDAYYRTAHETQSAALCLSGGGIRSASFCLGVLQALARASLLDKFHYLSTVSGGGYIGAWLSAQIKEAGGDAAAVQTRLAGVRPPIELMNLREFTNFLTPEPGLGSADTWTGIVLYIRNVLVNWMLFLPALFALAVAPVFYRDVLDTVGPGWGWAALAVGLLCLGIGVFLGADHLPSHSRPIGSASSAQRAALRSKGWQVWRQVVLPVLAWCFLAPIVAAPSLRLVMPDWAVPVVLVPLSSFVVMILAYLLAAIRHDRTDRKVFFGNFGWWALSALVAALILDLGVGIGLNQKPQILAVLGPVWVVGAHLVQSLVYVALRSEAFRGDLDREWLARLNALKVMPALLWAVFAAACLLLPALLITPLDQKVAFYTSWKPWVTGAVGLLTGPGAALLGKSSRSGGERSDAGPVLPIEIVIGVATAIFALILFAALGLAADGLTEAFAPHAEPAETGGAPGPLPWYRFLVDAVFFAVSAGLSYKLGQRINVNRFSMHAVYRSRLVRAFLGSARKLRSPDGFTGIDPGDNPRMSDLYPRPGAPLFHVINLALNLTAGKNKAWNERKAASFTVTPLRCGAADLYRKEDFKAGKPARGAYVCTADYAGNERETGPDEKPSGMTLGTAVTLSGAAVSPNMGYHSSAPTAFLMTLFNVRLGAWLPNPARAKTRALKKPKPENAVRALGRELAGRTDDTSPSIYLSDGGHFENLGIYEMVRRRCRYLVAIDAGQDKDAWFTDLGNAARKVYIDFGIKIRFEPQIRIGSRENPQEPVIGYAYGTIDYPEGGQGELLYLRPCDLPAAPIDVVAFRNESPLFPQESTLKQWFSESRFESYRALGDAEMSVLCGPHHTLQAFFAAVKADPLLRDGLGDPDAERKSST